MKTFFQIACILLALAASFAALALADAASPFAPQPGLLLLKNGQILEGGILREGDRFIVTIGERGAGGELKIPSGEVDAVCTSLEQAYEFKRGAITYKAVKPHVELADWCLRHKMVDRAADELVAAMAIDPTDPRIAAVERRMKFVNKPDNTRQHPGFDIPPGKEDIEQTIRTLPPEAVEEFSSNIQPLLLNRCAATACHGPSSTAEYRLVRPPLRHANKTRETQRNLFATLAQISPEGETALLETPLKAHGGQTRPVFDQQDRRQIEMLAAWIERVRSMPSTSAMREEGYVRPANFEEEAPAPKAGALRRLPSVEEPRAFQPEPTAKPLPGAGSGSKPTTTSKPTARDPFDARIFNERYHRQP